MALEFRNGAWYWRKMVNGVMFNRSTKTGDKKQAEQLVKKWEHEAVQSVIYEGERPITVHEAIKAFLEERVNSGGYRNACLHMKRWKEEIPNVQFKTLPKYQVQAVLTKMNAEGYAHNTVVVAVRYWNALVNYCIENKYSPGPKLDNIQRKRTRSRVISQEEEAAMLAATCPNAIYPGKNATKDLQRQENQDMLICLLHLGARLNEAQHLRWSDVNFDSNTIFVRRLKNSNDSSLLMTKAVRAVALRLRPVTTVLLAGL